jgi:hypothetical protein
MKSHRLKKEDKLSQSNKNSRSQDKLNQDKSCIDSDIGQTFMFS